eukprot:1261-Heterococcus_DN1.PRE.1
MAALYAELAWMAVLRDVPFSEYSTNPAAQRAAAALAGMEGYRGLGRPYTTNADGSGAVQPWYVAILTSCDSGSCYTAVQNGLPWWHNRPSCVAVPAAAICVRWHHSAATH